MAFGKRAVAAAAALALGTLAIACGSDDDSGTGATTSGEAPVEAPGAAATEAAPEAPPQGPTATGDLPESDESAVDAVVDAYIAALNRHDAEGVCNLFEPGGLPLMELPVRRGGRPPPGDCAASLGASIGRRPPRGGPAWKRTTIEEVTAVSVGGERARVTATVVHHFSDRRQPSLEEDVIYLDRVGDRWLLAKPSATLYRAVGYPEPPLRAFTPPRG